VDEYFEVKEPEVEKSEVEEPEEKESGEQELGVENVVPDRNLLDLVKESDLRVNDSQIVQDLELYFLGVKVKYYSIMDRNLGASEVYNQDWDNQNIESY
jgi:Na+-transporting NADH:ubiquinone oxidoreductase subunit NqrF